MSVLKKSRQLSAALVLTSILALICNGPAAALTITIDDTTDNVLITSDSVNTKVMNNGSEIFRVSDPLLSNAGTGIQADLVEPPGGLTGTQTVSDQIGVDPTTFSLEFDSDPDGGGFIQVNCSLTSVFDCLPETGNPVDVGPILYGPSSGISVVVTSDLDRVPEPASLAIFGAALAGLGLIRRRLRNV